MRFRVSSIVGHKAHFNRDEGQKRLVKVNTANGQKMKYRLHFSHSTEVQRMHKAPTNRRPLRNGTARSHSSNLQLEMFFILFTADSIKNKLSVICLMLSFGPVWRTHLRSKIILLLYDYHLMVKS